MAVLGFRESDLFSPAKKAALETAEAMTWTPPRVTDELFDEVRRHYSDSQIVEMAANHSRRTTELPVPTILQVIHDSGLRPSDQESQQRLDHLEYLMISVIDYLMDQEESIMCPQCRAGHLEDSEHEDVTHPNLMRRGYRCSREVCGYMIDRFWYASR